MKNTFLSLVFLGSFFFAIPSQAEPLRFVTFEVAPYEYTENGVIKGVNVDLTKEVFKRMQQPITIEMVPFSRGLEMVKYGEVDGMIGVYKTPEREIYAEYSQAPTILGVVSLIVQKSAAISFDGDFSKMSNYSFGFVRKFSYGKLFDNAVKDGLITKIDNADSQVTNIKKLLGGRFEVLVSDRDSAMYHLKKMNKLNLVKTLRPSIQESPIHVIFSKKRGLDTIITKFNLELAKLKNNVSYRKIVESYKP